MFRKYQGGANVKGGFYWNTREWRVVAVEGKKGTLPAGIECEYRRLPTLAFIPLALLLGGLYVVFLPLLGFAMLLSIGGRKMAGRLFALQRSLAQKFWALTAPEES